jgi:hypothetical protein
MPFLLGQSEGAVSQPHKVISLFLDGRFREGSALQLHKAFPSMFFIFVGDSKGISTIA